MHLLRLQVLDQRITRVYRFVGLSGVLASISLWMMEQIGTSESVQ